MRRFARVMTMSVGCVLTMMIGCTKAEPDPAAGPAAGTTTTTPAVPKAPAGGGGHSHAEVPLGTAMVGELAVECAQDHGDMAAGKEMHLVVKLPYNDKGASVVRAWIGNADRLGSRVAKGQYAASHDDYDVHAMAPDPLPEGAKWWIEVEKPDGSKQSGSIAFR